MVVPAWCSQPQECQARGAEKRAFPAEKVAKARPGAEETLPVLGMASVQVGLEVRPRSWPGSHTCPPGRRDCPKVVLVGGSLS